MVLRACFVGQGLSQASFCISLDQQFSKKCAYKSPVLYAHFITLHAAVRHLSRAETCSIPGMIIYCQSLLKMFVEYATTFYGPHFVLFNIHIIIHAPLDVAFLGMLYGFSCFPFEIHLQINKKTCRFLSFYRRSGLEANFRTAALSNKKKDGKSLFLMSVVFTFVAQIYIH